MMLIDIAKKVEKLAVDNSPAILTVVGVTGTLVTALLSGKASFKAADVLIFEQKELDTHTTSHELEPKEKFVLVWKLYIPAVSTGVLTVVCIVFANRIGTRRAAALAAAFTISEKAIAEYKDKVVERIGMPKEQKIRDEVAQEQVRRHPVEERDVLITGGGEVLCYDAFTGRYFKSDMETLKKAQNDLNYSMLNDGYASLGDFYGKIGLPTTSFSEEVGWTSEKLLEIKFSTVLSEDGRPCISIDFVTSPIRNYYKLN